MRARVAVLAVLPTVAGCSLLIDLDVGVRDTGEDGGSGDGGGGGDPDAGPCGSIGRLQDTFPEGPVSSRWVPRTAGSTAMAPRVSNGHLLLAFSGAPEGTGEFSEVESRFAYDLRGHAVTVRAWAADPLCRSTLEVREAGRFGTARRYIGLGRLGSDFAAFVDDGNPSAIESVPFSGAAHRFWRIREAAGTLEFEYADDSREFLPLATLPVPGIELDGVMIGLRLHAGDPAQTCNNGIELDDLNSEEVADPACPIEELRDDFSGGELSRLWFDSPGSCGFATGDGLTISPGAGSTCRVETAHAYSISGSELILELAAIPADPDARLEMRLLHDEDNYLELRQQAGVLRVDLVEDGVSAGSQSYGNAVGAQWWRVRQQDGQLEIATSDAGSDFVPRHTATPSRLDLAELRFSVSIAVAEPASVKLGSVNLAP